MNTHFFAASITASALALCAAPASAQKRPNILFVIVDDQSPFDLKVYDPNSPLRTPVLDRLAAEGMVLDGAYHMGSWSGAVCTPSRHMVMSGRTVWHLPRRGIRGEKQNPNCPEDLAENTMAAVFNLVGYDTMRTCKRGNSYKAANAQFTAVHDQTNRKAEAEPRLGLARRPGARVPGGPRGESRRGPVLDLLRLLAPA